MVNLTDEEFELAIQDALDSIPQDLIDSMENVVVLVRDEPTPEELADAEWGTEAEDGDLLGIYDGIPLTERGNDYGNCYGDVPDTNVIFKGPHERLEGTKDDILDEVFTTVIHEVGHYFGMTEEQIAEMGFE